MKKVPHLLYWLLVLLVLAYLVALSVFPVASNDIWLYLEIGRGFFSGEGVPTTDVFRFTGPSAPLDLYHELGSMLAFYLAYAIGGFNAVILAKTALLLAIAAIPFWVAWKLDRRRPNWLLPVISFLAIYGASLRFIERGSLFSDLFSVLVTGLIILIRAKAGNVRIYRAAIPAVFLVWVNFHAGFVVGFLILCLWLLAELVNLLLAGKNERAATKAEISSAARILLGSLLLGLVNPRGIRAYEFLARIMLESPWQATRSSNPEFMSPFAKGFVEYLDIETHIAVMLACLMLVGYVTARLAARRAYRDLPVFEALCLGMFAGLGFSMVRFLITASFGAVLVAAAALAGNRLFSQRDAAPARSWRLLPPVLAAVGIAGCLLSAAVRGYGPPDGRRRIGLGVDTAGKPVRACEFIDKARLGVNIFNTYEYGAYMIWRWQGRRQVFVHGFSGDADLLVRDYAGIARSAQDFDRIVRTYDIGAFLLRSMDLDLRSPLLPAHYRRLLRDREWHLVYADDVAQLFLRDVPENREIIRGYSTRAAGRSGT